MQSTVNTPRGPLSYILTGEGAPLLILHGGPGSSQRYVEPLAKGLAAHFRCISFDHPGNGESTVPSITPDTVGLNAILCQAEHLREHLGFDSWHVLGHSFGGLAALQYTCAQPLRVRKLALVASCGADLSFMPYFRDNLAARQSAADRLAMVAIRARLGAGTASALDEAAMNLMLAQAMVFRADAVQGIAERFASTDKFNAAVNAVAWQDLMDRQFDIAAELSGIAAPTLIVAGRQDYVGEAVPLATAQRIAHAKLHWLNRCGHLPWVDCPEEFFALVAGFFTAEQAPSRA
jgi:proline iminopeptidase